MIESLPLEHNCICAVRKSAVQRVNPYVRVRNVCRGDPRAPRLKGGRTHYSALTGPRRLGVQGPLSDHATWGAACGYAASTSFAARGGLVPRLARCGCAFSSVCAPRARALLPAHEEICWHVRQVVDGHLRLGP